MATDTDIQTFETIIILDEKITEERYNAAAYHFRDLIFGLPGTKIKTEKLGKKKLSYKTRGCTEGYYLLFTYQSTSGVVVSNLEKQLREDDNVIKFMTILSDKEYNPDPDPDAGISEQKHKRPVDVFDLIFEITN